MEFGDRFCIAWADTFAWLPHIWQFSIIEGCLRSQFPSAGLMTSRFLYVEQCCRLSAAIKAHGVLQWSGKANRNCVYIFIIQSPFEIRIPWWLGWLLKTLQPSANSGNRFWNRHHRVCVSLAFATFAKPWTCWNSPIHNPCDRDAEPCLGTGIFGIILLEWMSDLSTSTPRLSVCCGFDF